MKDVTNTLSTESTFRPTKNKIRIFSQVCYYKRRSMPKMEMEKNDIGLIVNRPNWYDEDEFAQLAVNFNGDKMSNEQADKLLSELFKAIKQQMRNAGVL